MKGRQVYRQNIERMIQVDGDLQIFLKIKSENQTKGREHTLGHDCIDARKLKETHVPSAKPSSKRQIQIRSNPNQILNRWNTRRDTQAHIQRERENPHVRKNQEKPLVRQQTRKAHTHRHTHARARARGGCSHSPLITHERINTKIGRQAAQEVYSEKARG